MDEDDPNILLAIQLSLQESGLVIDDETRDFLTNEASLGAIGTSLPTRLDSGPVNVDNPRAALSSTELLELGDSLIKLSADSDQFLTDHLSSRTFNNTRSGLYSASGESDSGSQDLNINENLLGNIMAWFHDMNPQSIALIPSAITEADDDSQQPSTEERLMEQPQVRQDLLEENAPSEDALKNEGRSTQREEGATAAGDVSYGETVPQSEDASGDTSSQIVNSDVSRQTSKTSAEWAEHVHLV